MKIPIVNEQDEIIKIIDSADRQKNDIGRVSGLWITNEKDEVLLAQRASTKRRDPSCWGPAVSGTVEEGETYEQNIGKEAGEEIGLFNFTPIISRKTRRSTSHEYFCQWYTAVVDSDYPFLKQDSEVDQIKWFKKDEILKLFENKPEMFVHSFIYTINYFIKNEN